MSHTRMPAPGSLLAVLAVTFTAAVAVFGPRAEAQAPGPSLIDPTLSVRTVASGLVTPTSMAFLGPDDMLVLEKQTGKVQRVIHIRTEYLGPEELLIAAKIALEPGLPLAEVAQAIDDAEARVRASVPEVNLIYLEPDLDRAHLG